MDLSPGKVQELIRVGDLDQIIRSMWCFEYCIFVFTISHELIIGFLTKIALSLCSM